MQLVASFQYPPWPDQTSRKQRTAVTLLHLLLYPSQSELAKMTIEQRIKHEEGIMTRNDILNSISEQIEEARKEAIEIGIREGREEGRSQGRVLGREEGSGRAEPREEQRDRRRQYERCLQQAFPLLQSQKLWK